MLWGRRGHAGDGARLLSKNSLSDRTQHSCPHARSRVFSAHVDETVQEISELPDRSPRRKARIIRMPPSKKQKASAAGSTFFPGIEKIKYKGPSSKDPMAFKYYNAEEVIMGRKMKDWCRFGIARLQTQPLRAAPLTGARTRLSREKYSRVLLAHVARHGRRHLRTWRHDGARLGPGPRE